LVEPTEIQHYIYTLHQNPYLQQKILAKNRSVVLSISHAQNKTLNIQIHLQLQVESANQEDVKHEHQKSLETY
jgi:CRISPR/Cas system endoribonuclease Cas6 (RAMP superfamily)